MKNIVIYLLFCSVLWINFIACTQDDDKQFLGAVDEGGKDPLAEICPFVEGDNKPSARMEGEYLLTFFLDFSKLGVYYDLSADMENHTDCLPFSNAPEISPDSAVIPCTTVVLKMQGTFTSYEDLVFGDRILITSMSLLEHLEESMVELALFADFEGVLNQKNLLDFQSISFTEAVPIIRDVDENGEILRRVLTEIQINLLRSCEDGNIFPSPEVNEAAVLTDFSGQVRVFLPFYAYTLYGRVRFQRLGE